MVRLGSREAGRAAFCRLEALASVTSTAGADLTWLILFSVGAGLISILRHDANALPASVPEAVKTPGG